MLREWINTLEGLFRSGKKQKKSDYAAHRGSMTHVIILDGTMCSLKEGQLSNAGLTYRLLEDIRNHEVSIYYEAGLQWGDWSSTLNVIAGNGINLQIRRAYGHLASRYRAGDKIYFFGYSRGAYAARSLAGMIGLVGLLRAEHATERNIRDAYRHYQLAPGTEAAQAFSDAYCHPQTMIEMVGVWDTVKALGLRLPVLWRWSEPKHAFHNHRLGPMIRHGFQALALDETRNAYAPVMWQAPREYEGEVVQAWFRGSHSDIGGHLGLMDAARPLSNIPLAWMLEHASECGLRLPTGWQTRYPTDPDAPSVGNWRGWGIFLLSRSRRKTGKVASECLHESVAREVPGLARCGCRAEAKTEVEMAAS